MANRDKNQLRRAVHTRIRKKVSGSTERPRLAVFRSLNLMGLAIQALHIGMNVRHPHHGVGVVKSLTEHTAEIVFDDTQRTVAPESSDLSAAEPVAQLSELQVPLDTLIRQTAQAVVDAYQQHGGN